MEVLGECEVQVSYKEQNEVLPLVVVGGSGPDLIGRNWLKFIRLDWKNICRVSQHGTQGRLEALLGKYKEVLSPDLGAIKSLQAKLHVKKNAEPKFCKARPVPFALRKAIEDELDRLEKEGILNKVDHSDWAAPIVPVPKKNGQLRICGDYKVTINPVIDVDKYPLPRPEDMLAALAGGEKFTKLDLTNAYLQMVLDPECRKFVTINTHRGLYEYTRLPFGISSAPAQFQKTMDIILQGLPKVLCYIDDILVTGKDDDDHYANLENVLKRLKEYGLKLKREKCAFLRESIEYLGHKIDSKGDH